MPDKTPFVIAPSCWIVVNHRGKPCLVFKTKENAEEYAKHMNASHAGPKEDYTVERNWIME